MKEWIKIIICSLPVFIIGFYHGGLSQLAIYLMGLYMVLLLSVFLFLDKDKSIEKNKFLFPIVIFTCTSFIVTLFAPAFLSSMGGFLEYFAYLIFFVSLLLIKPDKEKLLLSIFVFCLIELIVCFFQLNSPRVSGTYGYANFFVFPLVFGFLYSLRLGNKIMKYSLMALFFVFSILTASRIVLILILVLPVLFVKRKVFAFFAPILIGLVLLIPNPIKKRVIVKVQTYSLQRPNIWKQAIRTGLNRPIVGWGLRSFEKASLKYNFPVEGKYSKKAKIAHNQFLQYFAEGGMILFLSYAYLFFVFFINFKKFGEIQRILITIIFIHSLFDNILYLPVNFLIFIVILFTAESSEEGYKANLSLPVKLFVALLSLIYLFPLASYFFIKRGESEFKDKKYMKSLDSFSLAESLWPQYQCTISLARVNEQMFYETNVVDFLFIAFDLYRRAMYSNPIDWETPFKIDQFLKRHKKVVAYDKPDEFLLKAIELNPKERKLYEILMRDYRVMGIERKAREVELKIDSLFLSEQ